MTRATPSPLPSYYLIDPRGRSKLDAFDDAGALAEAKALREKYPHVYWWGRVEKIGPPKVITTWCTGEGEEEEKANDQPR